MRRVSRCHLCARAHARAAWQILSGDAIEATVGVALSLSTMAAAGCGNMVSDVLGIGISGQIEARAPRAALLRTCMRADVTCARSAQRACDAAGFRSRLTAVQMQMRTTQSAQSFVHATQLAARTH
jgi:hypothetical protein